MALADYLKCAVCQGKAVYDGDWSIRDRRDEGVDVEALCPECSCKHVLRAIPRDTVAELLVQIRAGLSLPAEQSLRAWGALSELLLSCRPLGAQEPEREALADEQRDHFGRTEAERQQESASIAEGVDAGPPWEPWKEPADV